MEPCSRAPCVDHVRGRGWGNALKIQMPRLTSALLNQNLQGYSLRICFVLFHSEGILRCSQSWEPQAFPILHREVCGRSTESLSDSQPPVQNQG